MHLIESKLNDATPSATTSASLVRNRLANLTASKSAPAVASTSDGRKIRWETDDTEDSGVDSVSSMVEAETAVHTAECEARNAHVSLLGSQSVEYADVIIGNNNQVSVKSRQLVVENVERQKSFLHTVYGGLQVSTSSDGDGGGSTSSNNNNNCVIEPKPWRPAESKAAAGPASASSRSPLRKNFEKIMAKYSTGQERGAASKSSPSARRESSNCWPTHRSRDAGPPASTESAKNFFLNSLLSQEVAEEGDELTAHQDQSPPRRPVTSVEDHLVPKLAQLLDAVEIQSTGPDSLLLITRDGTRASLRLTLTPTKSGALSCSHSTRRNSFNRLHRGSKRASQRRNVAHSANVETAECKAEEVQTFPTAASTSAAPTTAESPVKEGGTGAKRTRSVRRRPSQGKSLAKKGFSMSMAIPPSKVATLASKFNSLISSSATGPVSSDKKRLSSRHALDTADAKKSSVRSLPCRLIETIPEASNASEPSEAEAEAATLARETAAIGRDLEHGSGGAAGGQTFQSDPRPRAPESPPGPSAGADQRASSSNGVYGTVKSIVKQAIRKFEKLDSSATATSSGANSNEASPCVSRSWHNISTSNYAECSHEAVARTISLVADLPTHKEPCLPDGIAPNNSFLWRDRQSIQNLIYEATMFNERQDKMATGESYYEIGLSKYDTLGSRHSSTHHAYDTLKSSQSYDTMYNKSSSSSSHGYDLIGPAAADREERRPTPISAAVSYDDIKLSSLVTYDELTFMRRPSNGYDELQSAASDGYIDPGSSSAIQVYESMTERKSDDASTVRYEEFGTPDVHAAANEAQKSTTIVSAVPARVCEDQMDSISYLYDDIHGYGGSHHSYEPIYARLNGSSMTRPPSGGSGSASAPAAAASAHSQSDDSQAGDHLSDYSEEGVHEVVSYQLTHLGAASGVAGVASATSSAVAVPDSPAPSLATSRAGTERRSETSDEWIDISDGDLEEPAWIVTRTRHDPAVASFSRRAHRQSRRRSSAAKIKTLKGGGSNSGQTWSQTVRTLVKNGFSRAAQASREALDKQAKSIQSGGSSVHRRLFVKKPSARRLPSAETEASGTTGSSQTWEECGESDGDELADDHHYEALYEVINPGLQPSKSSPAALDSLNDSFDDSFDSDDAFEEVVVRGLDTTSDTSRERPESRSGSERSKESEDPSLRSQREQYAGITRFAEAASAQMKRLRRNWSSTKTDISRSISRMKKRSTVSVAELGEVFKSPAKWRDSSPEKAKEAASPTPPSGQKKGTWALRQFRRRTTITPPHGLSANNGSSAGKRSARDTSTFYLTLTIEAERQSAATRSKSAPGSDNSSPEPVSTPSPVPPLVSPVNRTPLAPGGVPLRPKRTSSASPGPHNPTPRPKTAPPDPPVKAATAKSADQPAKRPLTRLTSAFNETQLAMEKSSLMDQCRAAETLYSDIALSVSSNGAKKSEDELSRFLFTSDTPYSRLSLASCASRNSSETYIGVNDLASSPESANRPRDSDEVRSYMDLQPPLEAEEMYMSSHFADEPLYQFYTAAIIERAAHNQGEVSEEEDDYEVIGEHRKHHEEEQQQPAHQQPLRRQLNDTVVKEDQPSEIRTNKLPTAMELVTPISGRRTLWCELPEVINSGLLESISSQQRKLQEAMFELITSEASYLRSLNVLTTHFIQSREFSGDMDGVCLLSRIERHTLFSDILPVRECSERLLADLEKRWQESVLIREICDILLEHATRHFEVYIKYCTNQLYQERMLRELKENKPQFVEVLKRLEASPVCQSLAMHSFLMLPMQRITRLPLLVDAIFHRLDSGTPQFERCRQTLATLNKIVQECNEGARKAERIHEMLVVSNQLDFADVKAISVMSASRWLVKKGELQRLSWRDIDAPRLTFGRKIHKQTVYVFLFTDLLVITKKKGDDSYTVLDYCPRNMIQVEEYVRTEKPTGKSASDMGKNLILLTMLQNHESKTVEMILSCSSESDRTRWLEAVTPRTSDNPEEKIYEEWDCPQVQAIHSYVATQPDELSLEIADVVNVLRKMADGWYQGERLRDGERGWFPGNYTVEIASAHVRARNLRQRYRLLALSGNFIEEQARRERDEQKRKSKKLGTE